ncbi:MAG: glycosyltransferase [Sphingobacteriaceae bacterium]|nr:glycosyltransferase [Sphingobacteriaceae bacterium]
MSNSSNTNFISVILPVYNGEKYLREAIESVLNQTYRNFELIIVNDGSTDQSLSIIHSFSDNRIICVNNQQNAGLIEVLNQGISLAKGEFIARMDADDICMPERFKMQMEVFEKNPEVVLVSSDYFQMEDGHLALSSGFIESDELKTVLLFSPGMAHPTVVLRNSFQQNQKPYDINFIHAEDYKLWIDLSEQGKFYNIPLPLLKYRTHTGQISQNYRAIQKTNSEKIRALYLTKKGFQFSDQELRIHHLIGNNTFIQSMNELIGVEDWLIKLVRQNQKLHKFNAIEFNRVIAKFWYDSCGFSLLGINAYRRFYNSELAKLSTFSFQLKFKLLIKCFIRKFRKK